MSSRPGNNLGIPGLVSNTAQLFNRIFATANSVSQNETIDLFEHIGSCDFLCLCDFMRDMNASPKTVASANDRAFSLVELLTVIAIFAIILGFSSSAFQSITQGNALDRAVVGISSALELARQNSITKSTYSWVGMNSRRDANRNVVTVATFASVDGTRGPNVINADNVRLISKVEEFEDVDLADQSTSERQSNLPTVSALQYPKDSKFSPSSNDLPERYAGLDVDWVVLFTPRGEAAIDRGPSSGQDGADADSIDLPEAVQLVVVPRRGESSSEIESKSATTMRIGGLTGQVTVFRPGVQN